MFGSSRALWKELEAEETAREAKRAVARKSGFRDERRLDDLTMICETCSCLTYDLSVHRAWHASLEESS